MGYNLRGLRDNLITSIVITLSMVVLKVAGFFPFRWIWVFVPLIVTAALYSMVLIVLWILEFVE